MIFDVSTIYAARGTAKLADLPVHEARMKELVPDGAEVTLTGNGLIWLYLRLAHASHGRVRRLAYESPVAGRGEIFNHDSN